MSEKKREPEQELELGELLQIRRDKLARLREAGKDPFVLTKCPRDAFAEEIRESFDENTERHVCIAGRVMSRRDMGKASFLDIHDKTGRMQVYVKIDEIGEDAYREMKECWDVGDLAAVEGFVFRTRRGVISVHAQKLTLLGKSLLPLPEKFHGLKDTELRFRQRYVDLIMNPEVKRNFVLRSQFIKHVRDFLDARGYMEVETPVLNTISGGATARPFITHHNTLDIDMYMRIATELPLKRLIVGGLDRVYELGRIFRNEGMDPKHNPEFTTVELYEAYADFNDMMDLFEELLSSAAQKLLGTYQVEWQGERIDLTPGWPRLPMHEAVKRYTGLDFMAVTDDEEAVALAKSIGVELPPTADRTWGNALYEVFDQRVEEKLIQPTFITMHPVDVSPLAKRYAKDPRLTERFELFICHSEMGNAFSELNDPIDQRARFQKQVELRAKGDDEAGMMDEDFLTALEYGMPPTGGLGIGIDRCVMLLTNSDSIREVILFPTMKPIDPKPAEAPKAAPAAPAAAEAPEVPAAPDFSKVKIEPLFEELVDFETFSKSDFRVVKVISCEAVPKSRKLLKFVLDDGARNDRVILSGIHEYYEPEELLGKTLVAITNLPPRKMMGIDSEGMLLSAVCEDDGKEKLNLLMVDPAIPAGAKLY